MSVMLDIKVMPNAGKTLCARHKTGGIVCYVKSSPERGLANKELIAYLAKMIGVPQRDVTIVHGLTDRKKRVRIETTMHQEQVLELLAIAPQQMVWL